MARAQTVTRATLAAELAAIATAIDREIDPTARDEVKRIVARFRGKTVAWGQVEEIDFGAAAAERTYQKLVIGRVARTGDRSMS